MKESVLNQKRILAVDDEPDILEVLKEEIRAAAPKCTLDMAGSYGQAVESLTSWTYDLAILDIMGVEGFELLGLITKRPYPTPVAMLTAHASSPASLKKSIELGARAYIPKERLGAVVPFLEDVMTYEYGAVWRRILKQMEGLFSNAWGPYWRKPDEAFWKKFEERITSKKPEVHPSI
jgi:CheY-like chemotaxis protein